MNEQMPQGKQTVSDEQIIEAIETHGDPFVVAGEIGELFGSGRQWAHRRLKQLCDDGPVIRKQKSRNSVIYWLEDPPSSSEEESRRNC